MMAKIRVVLAEDHVLMREGTRELLEREDDMIVVGEAGDGEEVVRLAAEQHPDVVLMDINMPVLSGIEATRRIKTASPSMGVLVLTAYPDDQYVFALLEAGAAGYLLKDVRARDLVEAVRAVHAGDSVLHPIIARKVIARFSRKPAEPVEEHPLDQLSEREMEVLKLAAKGITNREIARDLVISVRTVQGHLHNTFEKMGVGSRTEAVVRALQKGWLTVDDTL